MRCGSDDRIASGEIPIFGVDCGDYAARMAQRAGQPLANFYPKEGAGLLFFAPGIPNTAAHPYAARLLLAFFLSKEGQKALWDVMGTDDYRLPGSHMSQVVGDAKKRGVKVIEAFGLDTTHPELLDYEKTIDDLVNKSQ
jgi:ABC-type Fe3+ transport system substrate-binding protein